MSEEKFDFKLAKPTAVLILRVRTIGRRNSMPNVLVNHPVSQLIRNVCRIVAIVSCIAVFTDLSYFLVIITKACTLSKGTKIGQVYALRKCKYN